MKLSKIAIGAAMLVGTSAYAAGHDHSHNHAKGTFSNNLFSAIMVSPTQIYQTPHAQTDLQFNFGQNNSEGQILGQDFDVDVDSFGGQFGGTYSVHDNSVTFSIAADWGQAKVDEDGAKSTFTTTLRPQIAYKAGNIVLGTGFAINSFDQEDNDDFNNSNFDVTPAIAWVTDTYEAGLFYKTKTFNDRFDGVVASNVGLHTRYAMGQAAVGGIITGTLNKAHEETDTARNKLDATLTAEYAMNKAKLEFDFGHTFKNAKEDSDIDLDSMGTWDVGLAGDYSVAKHAVVGLTGRYMFGSDDNDANVEFKQNAFNVGLRGQYAF